MPKLKLPDWNWWALIPLAGLILLAGSGFLGEAGQPHSYSNAANAQRSTNNHAGDDPLALLYAGIAGFLGNPAAVEAGATVLLAIITVFLVFIARGQHRTTRAQLRCYCGPEKFEYHVPQIDNAAFNIPNPLPPGYIYDHYLVISAKNYGSTPASNLSVFVNWYPIPFGSILPDDFAFDDLASNNSIGYFSNTVVDPSGSYEAMVVLGADDLATLRAAKARVALLFLYGHVDYSDVFQRRWRRDFCVQWCPWNEGVREFVPYKANNRERQIKRLKR